jgi:hypothetical protein
MTNRMYTALTGFLLAALHGFLKTLPPHVGAIERGLCSDKSPGYDLQAMSPTARRANPLIVLRLI